MLRRTILRAMRPPPGSEDVVVGRRVSAELKEKLAQRLEEVEERPANETHEQRMERHRMEFLAKASLNTENKQERWAEKQRNRQFSIISRRGTITNTTQALAEQTGSMQEVIGDKESLVAVKREHLDQKEKSLEHQNKTSKGRLQRKRITIDDDDDDDL
ncbi:hypothetical protein DIPPA_30289 [Diplonema papillatum]|nr:hypothetical protein DIPPA_30289 [Diplonema papillatum]